MTTDATLPDGSGSSAEGLATAAHVPCLKCGYDLFGARRNDHCTECGFPVQESLNPNRLVFVASRDLRMLEVCLLCYSLTALFWFAYFDVALIYFGLNRTQNSLVWLVDGVASLAILFLAGLAYRCSRKRSERLFALLVPVAGGAVTAAFYIPAFYGSHANALIVPPIGAVGGLATVGAQYLLMTMLCWRERRRRAVVVCCAAALSPVVVLLLVMLGNILRRFEWYASLPSSAFGLLHQVLEVIPAVATIVTWRSVRTARQRRARMEAVSTDSGQSN